MNKFIFDVDGTLTPSRSIIDVNFKMFFNSFCLMNDVYLVTGSDKSKTIEQISEPTYNLCKRVYNCNGNDVWEGNTHIRSNTWTLPEDAHNFLSDILTQSFFPLRTGLHFEHRPGMVNFSIVGRKADKKQRAQYVEWDKKYDERDLIAHNFNLIFTDLEATVGGETGLDIAPKGSDKSQILADFDKDDTLWFFGDAMYKGGNDYTLSTKVNRAYPVDGWKDTLTILQNLQNEGIAL